MHDRQSIHELEADWNHEQVDGRDRILVIGEKRSPGLSARPTQV